MSDPKYKHIGNPEDRIIEECGEILQAVIKGKRFGWDNHHPNKPNISNLRKLYDEIHDVKEAFDDLVKEIKKKYGLDKYCALMKDDDYRPMQTMERFKKG